MNGYDSNVTQMRENNPAASTILDGAMGTELARRGVDTGLPLWSANALLNAPQTVCQIHRDYLLAGAQVLTTNTFRTNTRTLLRAGLYQRMQELVHVAVALARQAAQETSRASAIIAGSLAPVEDCYSPWLTPADEEVLFAEHAELAGHLQRAGCDVLLVETMNTVREAAMAVRAAAATGLPVWVSFMLGPDNRLLSGEGLEEALRAVMAYRPQAVLVNCLPVAQVGSALEALRRVVPPGVKIGAYANAGHVEEAGWSMAHGVSPEAYAQAALGWRQLGAQIIGGCCGTTPDHIAAVWRLGIGD
jgi:S-methylmethionine-dependent homocysteine/selenocysteine methylase